ncbi:MAG: immunoglobulin domain-containing protein, partial [Dolichospermum sp.]
ISKITAAGSVTQAWATLAASSNPQFMVFDPTGNMYVSCWGTSKVAKINSSGTVTDNWSVGTDVLPAGIVLDAAGNIFTSNYYNHTISKVTSSGAVTQAYVTLANGSYPFYLAKDASGNLYTTNMGNGTVSRISVPSVSITSNASGAVCAGTSVTFTATVTGISSPTYQWYKNGTAISSANSSTYSSSTLSNNDVIKVSAGDAIVTSSLIQNLDANNTTSYSSGNTWTDLTMNGNSGTINTMSSGSVAIVTEGTIKSFKYTKGLSYIAAPLSKTASMTFNVWAKTSSLSNYSSGTMLFNAGTSGTGPVTGGPDLFIAANKIFWNTYDGTGNPFKLNGTDITTTTASINDVNWHYFTVVVDAVNNTASLYIDGVFKGVAVYKDPRMYSSTALFIGGEGNNANITNYDLAWDGNISAFQSYSRALSLMEVVQNFNSKAAFFGANSAALNVSNSITASITGSTPTLTVTGDGCASKTTLSTTSGLTSYTWYKDNVAVNGATSNVYTPTAAGVYKVEVTTGSCSSTSTTTSINTCGRTATGQMSILETSSTLVSKDGALNNGKGVDSRGSILSKP